MKKSLRLLSIVLFAMFLGFGARAQVQVGAGTVTGQSLPIEPYYGYSYSQQIYLASEINASGTITQLKFYFAGSSLSSSNNWTIYIGHTTKASFSSNSDWVAVSSLTQVYSGTFTSPNGAGWITFDITDWAYNGTDNIIIAVDENASGYDGTGDDFHCTSVSADRALEYHNDNTNPDPASPPSGTPRAYIANIIFDGISQACPNPSTQTESSITSSSVSLGWTENGSANTWNIEYGPAGFSQGSGTTISVTSNPYTLTGLSSTTDYDWYVQADCGGGSTSAWVGPNTFTTACATKATPWSDDVEALTATTSSDMTNCWNSNPSSTTISFRWNVDGSGSTPSSSTGPSGAHSGSKYFYTEASQGSQGDIAELLSPSLDLSSLTSPILEFYYHMYGADMGSLHVDIYDGVWHNDVMTAITGQQQTSDTDPWLKQTVNLSAYSGTIQIRFRGERGNGYYGDMAIDDISVKEAPACPDPSSMVETNKTATSVDLGWTENGTANTWNIEYGPAGFSQGSGTMVSGVTSNPYSLTGLTANTSYDWYVQADCGSGNSSNWTGPSNFYTGYCTPAPSSVDGDGITNVTFGQSPNVVNNTTGDEPGHYGDYSAQIGDIQRTATVSVDITYQTGYTYVTKIWIDWNDDLDFDDAGEEVYSGTSSSSNPTTLNASFTVPATAPLGNHRMRIGGADTGPPTPCYTGTYAAYEDYTVNVLTAPACPAPSAQTETNVKLNSVDLAWTENGSANTWNIEYGPTGFTQGSGTTVSGVTSNPYNIAGLTAGTAYDWYVQADCGASGGTGTSTWTGPHTFTTADGKAINPNPADGATGILVSATTLDWDDVAGADGYTISVGTTSGGTDVVNGDVINGASNSNYTLNSNLNYHTTYYWTITTNYNSGSSVTGDEWTFTSECGVYTPDYSEDFTTYLPTCWSEAQGLLTSNTTLSGTSSAWNQDDFGNVTANGKSAKINIYGTTKKEWLISPSIDLSGGNYQLEFDIALTDYGNSGAPDNANPPSNNGMGSDDTLAVIISTDNGATWSKANILQTWTSTDPISTTGDHIIIDLSAYNTTVKIAFYGKSSVSNEDNDLFIDNFLVRTPPACQQPTALATNNITINSVELSWTENGSATHWNIEYGSTGFTQGSGTTISGVTSKPYSLTGLTAGTAYDWYVQADCGASGGTGTSTWTGPHTFTTADGKAINPNPADGATGILVSATTLDWDDVAGADGYHISVGTTPGGTDVVNNVAITGATNSTYTVSSNWNYGTTYYWTISTDYNSGSSVTGDEWTFTTECATYSTPWTEDFESMTNTGLDIVPDCMQEDGDWATASSSQSYNRSAHSGTNYVYTKYTADDWLFTPKISVTAGTSYDFTFYYVTDGNSGWTTVETKYGTSQTAADMTTTIGTALSGPTNTTYQKYTATFTPSTSGDYYFGIHVVATSSPWFITFDDLALEETPACPTPTTQTETNITSSSVDLGWTESGSATVWDIEYGAAGFSQGSGTMISGTTTNPHSLSGLNSGTSYDWYVRANCGSGSASSWEGPHTFSTNSLAPGCATSPTPSDASSGITSGTVTLSWTAPVDDATHDAATSYDVYLGTTSGSLTLQGNTSNTTYDVSASIDLTTYYWKVIPKNSAGSATGCPEWSFTTAVRQSATTQTAPWSEDFSAHSGGTGTTTNGWLTEPTSGFAWTVSTNGTTPSSATGPSTDHSGDDHFIFTESSSGSQGDVALLYSPKLDLSALTTPELTFYYYMYGASTGELHIDVYDGSSYTNDVAAAIVGQQQTSQSDPWLKYTVNLSSYSGIIHIRFRGIRGSSYTGDISIDDFDIHEAPACPDPSLQTTSNVTTQSVDLGWTENGSATQWSVEYGPTGFTQGSGTTINGVSSNPYSLSGLTANTTYDWYIQSDCGNVTTSNWVGPHTFATSKEVSGTLSGKTSKCSPIYQRADAGTPPTSTSTKYVFYDKFSFTAPVSGKYDILANWSYDGYLHIYENSFDPANPLTNCIGGDDDFDNGGGTPASGSKIENINLTSGTTYIVVGSSYNSYVTGTADFWIEGAGLVSMPSRTDYHGAPYKSYTIPPTDGTARVSDYECDDDAGWTTYYDDNGTASDYTDDNLLLAVKKNSNNFGSTSVTLEGNAGASEIAPSTTFSKYVNSFQGWYVFNRYWKLSPTTQPTSDVQVRFYYQDADFNDLNTALNNANRTPIANITDMSVYKINDLNGTGYDPNPANGHNNVPKASAYDADGAWIYSPPGASTTVPNAKWTAGDYGSDHYFEFTVAHFSGGGGGASGTADDGTLPIELLSFDAFAKGDINRIVWKTASEYNVEKFVIERMNPSTQEIEEIGTVRAAGNSNEVLSYRYDDAQPLEEAYYRLRNVDYDGATETFNWVYVKRGATEFKLVSLYPNPSSGSAHIDIVNPTAHKLHIELRDMLGKIVFIQDYDLMDGLQSVDLDLSGISAGTYYLSLDNTNDRIIKMLIVK